MRYAVVNKEDETVINVIDWDGKSEYYPGDDFYLIQSDTCEIGHFYEKGSFVDKSIKKQELL